MTYVLSYYILFYNFKQDVLGNDDIKLDWMMKNSFISDLVKVCLKLLLIIVLTPTRVI